jgi:hypothetical protein
MRDSLADNDKTRWSDARLIRLVDEAQKDFAVKARMLRTKVDISIIGGQAEYLLPENAYLMTRVVTEEGKLELVSHDSMDELVHTRWETVSGTNIEYIVFDKQNPRAFKVYPIPIDSDSIGDTYTLSDYGVTTLVENDIVVNDFGVVAEVSESAADTSSFNSPYGIMVDMVSVVSSVTVYYRRTPNDILSITDTPDIDRIWDKGLRYYALGLAFADDKDSQNLAMSDKFMGMYGRELAEATAQSARNSTSPTPRNTQYNRAI